MATDQVNPAGFHYALQLTLRADDPIVLDRARLETRMTAELIDHMAREGFELPANTKLPGFSLHRHGDFVPPGMVVVRIECDVWKAPPELAGRLARGQVHA